MREREYPKHLAGLRARRKAAGLTQEEVSEALDVNRSSVANWELGYAWPGAWVLPRLADLLLCSIDDLYTAPEGGDN